MAGKEEAVRKIGKTERKQVAGGSGTVMGRESIRGEVVESPLLRELAEMNSPGAQGSHGEACFHWGGGTLSRSFG